MRDHLTVDETERGWSVDVAGTIDPRLGVPWLAVAVGACGVLAGLLITWSVALPFLAIGLGLFTPRIGTRMYGLLVERGRLELVGAEALPLHTFDTARMVEGQLELRGDERTIRLSLDARPDDLAQLAATLQETLDAQGDAADVPDTLAVLQRDASGGET
jgi:hypothetical protein